jgi:puromycin-sensitive aminopeptidase
MQAVTRHGVVIRCFTPPGKSKQGAFALTTAVRALDIYDDYFGIPYPLPKLDMLAVPEFMAGAMENWGLVIYRGEFLLIDDARASAAQRQMVAIVVAHELAHMWFGNLVTMEWWNDLWLNEGFASFMEEYVTNQIFPDWDIWGQYTIDVQQSALNLDALRTSHPIQVAIRHSSEVDEIFDQISYEKGACPPPSPHKFPPQGMLDTRVCVWHRAGSSVIRMVHAVLGAQAFQAGLAAYFARHSYGNTVTHDLWQAWEDASGKPISKVHT